MAYDKSAVVSTHLDAAPEQVYQALTDAGALQAWYWPPSMSPSVTSDPVVGGGFGVTSGNAGVGFTGEYAELDPPRRIVQSWRWLGDDRDSRVTIDLVPAGDGTDLTVVHDRVDAETAAAYGEGWRSCLDRLPGYLT
jgi:uncharacterized protein YndB with AHSA1/START domain